MFKGFGGVVKVKGEGTLVWKIEDDDGGIHTIKIKSSLYIPEVTSCFLAPQQWSQQENGNYTNPYGTWCSTKAHH